MAESMTSTSSSGEEEQVDGPVRKRPRIDTDNDSSTDLGVNQLRSSDQSRIKQKRKTSDPLPDLTKDQRVVLYTLLLCVDDFNGVDVHDDVSMADIDVRRTLIELEERGLVQRYSGDVSVFLREYIKIMISYRENCLLSDIDKDFYLQVATERSSDLYFDVYVRDHIDTEQPEDFPITLMRLVIEGRAAAVVEYDREGFKQEKGFQNFTQWWCRMKNLDPVAWADGIQYKEFASFLSAYCFLKGLNKGFTELVFDQKRWIILIAILMSEKYTISVNALYGEELKKIQGTFPSLRESNHHISTTEAVELIKDLVHNHKLLTMNGDDSSGTVEFISDDVRHQVMGYFVLDCVKTDEDYANYLNLSSVDSLLEYVCPSLYTPPDKERYVYLPKRMTEVFIRRLGIDAIRHVMVEKREGFTSITRIKTERTLEVFNMFPMSNNVDDDDDDGDDDKVLCSLRQKVSEILSIPYCVFEEQRDTIVRLCSFVKTAIQKQDVTNTDTLIYNSLIGSFMIGENSSVLKEELHSKTSMAKWSILVVILMSVGYKLDANKDWKDNLENVAKSFPELQNKDVENYHVLMEDLIKDKVLKSDEKKNVTFVSHYVRHHVMSFFVKSCLKTDEDYANYLNISSVDSLMEYVRPWEYKPRERERCIHLPEKMTELFITTLGIDTICHVMVVEETKYIDGQSEFGIGPMSTEDMCYHDVIKETISSVLKVPLEILEWDYAARSRYAECVKKGTQTIHRARAMIVGCAGAGKTTLLKRLQKRSLNELKKVQSTIGLDVHQDIFEIPPESDCLKDIPDGTDKEMKQLLSVVDFGGQCAYYACHQVYLSRRAFYLLVIDMSKAFNEKVDPALCEQAGTMFTDWSYGEYLLFWLKSVHTYCDNDSPVIIVGTHLDETSAQNSDTFYNCILETLKFDKHLKSHLDRKRCFVVGFKSDGSSFQDTLSELEKCMVSISKQNKWKEVIPTDWALSEVVLRELRRREVRMISVTKLSQNCFGENEEKYTQISDILRFYHDIGVVLHFDESCLAETAIIDIQWFVDSFKNIITDPNHVRDIVENDREWSSFFKSGHIQDRLLDRIWGNHRFNMNYWRRNANKAPLLQYMERLGLISVGIDAHYIPCMNKLSFGEEEERFFQSIQSTTSVLVFRFHFLPYFFYFRLIVACLTKTNGEWEVLEDKGLCLYKNVACFVYKGHDVAMAVNKYSIQIQVFQPRNVPIVKDVTLEIRDNIEKLLNGLTSNFHKKIMYDVGYQCSKQEVFREHDDCFVEERQIHGKGNISCPKHGLINHHVLSESAILFYWNQDVLADVTDLDDLMDRDECTNLSEPELRKFNFKSFDELTKIGRNALQIYFDRIFPPMDLAFALSNNEHSLQHGHHRLDADQCTLLFPADRSIPSSAAFDVTIMYKLLRNYGPNIPPPSKGWGKKPDIGQKRPTDDVERIRLYRNEVQHKTPTTGVMEKDAFELKWNDLSQAILRLSNGSLKKDIMALRRQR